MWGTMFCLASTSTHYSSTPSYLAWADLLASVLAPNGDGIEGVVMVYECYETVFIHPQASLAHVSITMIVITTILTHHSSSTSWGSLIIIMG